MFAEVNSAHTWIFSGPAPRATAGRRLPRPTRWLALIVLLATGGLGPAHDVLPLAPVAAGPACEMQDFDAIASAAPASVEIDHQAILEIVRAHRRGTSDQWRQRLARAIYEESQAARIDPLMVAAIVAKESSFKSRVVSSAGAIGLMQLRPFVARDVAQRSEIAWSGPATLHDPELNVRLGILYYKELMQRFDGDAGKALTAYNYGPTRVSRQLRSGTFSGSRYARSILALYESLDQRRDALGGSLATSSS